MTNRTAPRVPLALALALLTVIALAGPVAAADPVTIEARAQVAGRFEANGWLGVAVTLSNSGEPTTGYVVADSEDGTVRRLVELPAGARKQVNLYVRPPNFSATVAVRFTDTNGTLRTSATASVRVLDRTAATIAIVGDPAGNLRPQIIGRAQGLPDPIPLQPADLPERPEPLAGLEAILWAADSSSLTEAQRMSLERWVAGGGHLVVIGGADWQARTANLADMLPVESITASDGVALAPLYQWLAARPPAGAGTQTVALGTPRSGAVDLVSSGDQSLFASMSRGAGRVTWIGADMATEPFRGWPDASALWSRLLPDNRVSQQMGEPGPIEDELSGFMIQALSNLPSLDVPGAELLLALLAAYILLIGPVSYFALRRLDRRELAWVTAPLLVVIFSTGTYGLGLSMKGSDIIVNEVSLVRATPDATTATVSTYAGVFSPSRASYDLSVPGEALMSGIVNNFVDFDPGNRRRYVTEQGTPSHLLDLNVSVFGLEAVRSETIISYQPDLDVEWSYTEGGIEGEVTNHGDGTVEDVAVLAPGGGKLVGTLEPGASETFELRITNVSERATSDQVYGFTNGGRTTAALRRIAVRRQVIDSLVGYGGFGGPVGSMSGGVGRGPYVIGWRVDESSMPIQLDGHAVQRYAQTVEVLAGTPRLGPGTVRIQPAQLTTELESTAGTVQELEPGWLTLGEGEVVFRLSLPLEASRIAPSKVELVVGSDPSVIYFNQAGFSSPLPEGYQVSAYDRASGDWIDVGDVSTGSHFVMGNPANLLDAGGGILIRVTGSDIDEEFGNSPVFVGALVEGVL
jgi:hypothetical protein